MLVWIPMVKKDPEGRGTVFVVKSTGDACCPVALLRVLLSRSSTESPIHSYTTLVMCLDTGENAGVRQRSALVFIKINSSGSIIYSMRA